MVLLICGSLKKQPTDQTNKTESIKTEIKLMVVRGEGVGGDGVGRDG